jgi:hypothetical protein
VDSARRCRSENRLKKSSAHFQRLIESETVTLTLRALRDQPALHVSVRTEECD